MSYKIYGTGKDSTGKVCIDIMQEVLDRTSPREFSTLRDDKGKKSLFAYGLRKLNTHAYLTRFYDLQTHERFVDLTEVTDLTGIGIKRVTKVYPSDAITKYYQAWRDFRELPSFFINYYRFHDNFVEFVMTDTIYRQIKRRYDNKDTDWQHIGDRIYLGDSWADTTRCMIMFIPEIDITLDYKDYKIELHDKEFNFVCDIMEAELYRREGLFQSMTTVMDVNVDYNLMITTGAELLERTMTTWNTDGILLSGRRF